MRPDEAGDNAGGRPRGDRFKDIAKDLLAIAGGQPGPEKANVPAPPPQPAPQPKVNIPLKDSENERARALVELDRKFIVEVGDMNPKASAYFRKRPFLTPEVCRNWRMGYLPRDAGGDKTGGTMRGQITYAYLSKAGEILCYFGRDPEFEDKHQKWEKSDKTESEPEKFHFVKGFHRGIELFGQTIETIPLGNRNAACTSAARIKVCRTGTYRRPGAWPNHSRRPYRKRAHNRPPSQPGRSSSYPDFPKIPPYGDIHNEVEWLINRGWPRIEISFLGRLRSFGTVHLAPSERGVFSWTDFGMVIATAN